MAGGSFEHNVIASNVHGLLYQALRSKPCIVFTSDQRIEVDEDEHYTYSDCSVVCGEVEFAKGRRDMITNPLVIIEVLSISTKDYDKGLKFKAYQNIKNFRDYILIDQEKVHIEYFHKDESGNWKRSEYKNIDDTLKIVTIDVEIMIKDIYNKVELNLKPHN